MGRNMSDFFIPKKTYICEFKIILANAVCHENFIMVFYRRIVSAIVPHLHDNNHEGGKSHRHAENVEQRGQAEAFEDETKVF